MYDKLKFFIPRTGSTQDVTPHLEKVCNVVDTLTGECTQVSGTIGGVKVVMYPNGISIIGSLPKFYNQSNVFTLDRNEVEAWMKQNRVNTQAEAESAAAAYMVRKGAAL